MKELYKLDNGYEYYVGARYSYGDLINTFEFETVLYERDNDYQGDSFYIFQDAEKYGMLIFGWGSCSGCDALEACDTYKQVLELRDNLFSSVKWFGNKDALCEYVANKDWEVEWYHHSDGGLRFENKLKEFCGIVDQSHDDLLD